MGVAPEAWVAAQQGVRAPNAAMMGYAPAPSVPIARPARPWAVAAVIALAVVLLWELTHPLLLALLARSTGSTTALGLLGGVGTGLVFVLGVIAAVSGAVGINRREGILAGIGLGGGIMVTAGAVISVLGSLASRLFW